MNVAPSKNTQSGEDIVRESRANPEQFVYCKGCGTPLESRSRLQKPRAVVQYMMCEPCREQHGHALMPTSGSPTFCYRCGREEEIFIEPSTTPITHHLCVHCLPERAERYRSGDFATPAKQPDPAPTTA